jgi:arylsulfatase A-like enzyme
MPRLTTLLPFLFLALAARAGDRPNLVLIVVDDLGWQETSVPFHGEITSLNRRYRTPAMERLAAEGVRLTNAHASAVCSPSRVSLMTGMNAARHGVTNWTLHRDRGPDARHPTLELPDWPVNGLAPAPGTPRTVVATPLPALLREAGYRTLHVGKAHFGAIGAPGADPLNLGFDVNVAGHAAGGPGSHLGDKGYSARWRGGEAVWDVPGLEAHKAAGTPLAEALTLEAVKAVETAVAERRPFFLHLAHYAVHAPYEADPRFIGRYREAGLSGQPAVLASMVEGMDKSVGDLLAALDRLGVADDTLVILISDNGSPGQCPPNLPLRGHKKSPYEGGLRVPALVRWPGKAKPGAVDAAPVVIEDLFPTLLEAAGLGASAKVPQVVDGRSWVPHLTGSAPLPADRPLVFHYPNFYDGQQPYSALLMGGWKLVHFHASGRRELYDLEADLGETRDLSASRPDKVAELAAVLARELRERGALMPRRRSDGSSVPPAGG